MFFGKLKSLFGRLRCTRVERIKRLVEDILVMNQFSINQNSEKLDRCLALMEEEVRRVRQITKSRPYISGDVWFEGAALAGFGEALANFLSDKNLLTQQAKATNLWAGAVVGVYSHYQHIVGPAMIASASINERIGNLGHSKFVYSAVLQDFEFVLRRAEEDEFKPDGEELIALQSLEVACNRLIALGEVSGVNAVAPDVLARVCKTMEKPLAPQLDQTRVCRT